ncbi:MAG: thioesterase family protein [Saprospiraceae bacterium]
MITHDTYRRVLYAETDKMGYLYYGHYASYYETGRAEFIRDHGITYYDLEAVHGVMMPVASLECRYRFPAHYDEKLIIRTYLKEIPSRIFHIEHDIINPSGQVINKGGVKLFFVDMKSGKNVSCPDYIKNAFEPYF